MFVVCVRNVTYMPTFFLNKPVFCVLHIVCL